MAMDHRQPQRRPPILLDLEVHIRFVRQQHFYRVASVERRCPVQGRESVPIQQIHIRLLSQKQFHHFFLTVKRRPMQRCLAAAVPGVDQLLVLFQKSGNLVNVADNHRAINVFRCPTCQQEFHELLFAAASGAGQHRPALCVGGVDQFRVFLQTRLDLFEIAQFSGFMDFRALDGDAPSHDGHGQDRAPSTEADGNLISRGRALQGESLFR